jgi:AraC family ethanolamine operon transcriptional activator
MLTVNSKFKEFDEFNEFIAAWDLDVRQIDHGCLNASLKQVVLSDSSLSKAKFDKTALQRGVAVPDMWTFAFLDATAPEVNWCGRTFSPDTVAIFPKNNEFCGVSPPGFHVYTVSFTEQALTTAAQALGCADICDSLSEHGEIRRIDRRRADRFCQQVNEAMSGLLTTHANGLSVEMAQKSLHQKIAEQLIIILGSLDSKPQRSSTRKLTAARNLALEYIEQHMAEGIGIRDVLRATGVSRRTLEYAFRDQIGISPKRFIKTQRLIKVRRELRHSPHGHSISDIASRWGFSHMGQFAADYRLQFGELPSGTLGKKQPKFR